MMRQYCKDRYSADEKGAVIVLFIFALVALLALAGLAIDAGNLYRAQLQTQKAADAAVLAGIGTTILDEETLKTNIEQRAREVAEDNLALAGLIPAAIVPAYNTASAPPVPLQVSTSVNVDFLLIDSVPFFMLGTTSTASGASVNGLARGQRRDANVSLLLDTSYSMDCPATGDCECQKPEGANMACPGERLDNLKTAVNTFIGYFNENRDRINVVAYDTAAELKYSASNIPFSKSALRGIVDDFTPAGNTNFCDAMYRAFSDISSNVPADQDVSYVFFSDGTPTAARLLFADVKSGAAGVSSPTPLGNYDYQHFSIGYAPVGDNYFGPSQMVKWNGLSRGYTVGDANGNPVPIGAAFIPGCSQPYTPGQIADPAAFREVFSGCLNTLAFHMPGTASGMYGANYGLSSFGTAWHEQYYNCAVQTSDFLREHRGIVYTIGLGSPACITADPYQNIWDMLSRKDSLMARIANDFLLAKVSPNTAELLAEHQAAGCSYAAVPPFPDYNFTNGSSYEAINATPTPRNGRYLYTTDATDLNELFKTIAVKIRLRLIK